MRATQCSFKKGEDLTGGWLKRCSSHLLSHSSHRTLLSLQPLFSHKSSTKAQKLPLSLSLPLSPCLFSPPRKHTQSERRCWKHVGQNSPSNPLQCQPSSFPFLFIHSPVSPLSHQPSTSLSPSTPRPHPLLSFSFPCCSDYNSSLNAPLVLPLSYSDCLSSQHFSLSSTPSKLL